VASQAASSATSNRWVVAAAAVVMQLGLGAVYAWSVFREPLSAHYGTGITPVNAAFFIAILLIGFAAFVGGRWMQRSGPRIVAITGGVFYGVGVFLAWFAGPSVVILWLTYGLLAGIGLGLGYIVPLQTLPKWFPDKPGLATGIAVAGFGAGSGLTVPLAQWLMSATGSPFGAFAIFGIAYFIMVVGAGFFMKNPPEGYGATEQEESGTEEEASEWDFRKALGTWQWYALWGILFLNTTAGLALISDAKAMATGIGGATTALALTFVVILAVANALGRLGWASLSDYIGPKNVFIIMFLLQAVLFLLMPILGYGAFVIFTILSFIVVACYGGGFSTMPAFVGAYYGAQNIGTIYGPLLTAWGIASLGAPLILAVSTDATGSYDLALYITAGISLVSTILAFIMRPPESPREEAEAGPQEAGEARA
jgi:OFA family oxalate/formate antiporter-like MFS transporter